LRWLAPALLGLALVRVAAAASGAPLVPGTATDGPIALAVDARDAARHVVHVTMSFPVEPGPLTLYYPQWIPGEHSPSGPLANVVGLRVLAGKKPIHWRRDPIAMFAIHCDVPAGARTVEVALDYLYVRGGTALASRVASSTGELVVLTWNQVLLYPAGKPASALTYAATLRLPAGWHYATALRTTRATPAGITFEPVTLEHLVDSPVLAGRHFRVVPLGAPGGIEHELDIAADNESELAISAEHVAELARLVDETGALFGTRHYRSYHFLLAIAETLPPGGLEHHESSNNQLHERGIVDDEAWPGVTTLFSHEFAHSWNGKFRRPAGLATHEYHTPMQGDLLWVYEGLTSYFGIVLAARSGMLTAEQARDALAVTAASLDRSAGRAWRPLGDTAVSVQTLGYAPGGYSNWRRSLDYYPEGMLLWFDVDVTIRRLTDGRKSLDDFCKLFFGGPGGPEVHPYAMADLTAALTAVAPSDWLSFLNARVWDVQPHPPLGGLENAGWHLTYDNKVNPAARRYESRSKDMDLTNSLGALVHEDGAVEDVLPGSPAGRAGLVPGMKIVAVGGVGWKARLLETALGLSPPRPIELLVENAERFTTLKVDGPFAPRYAHLQRKPGEPDRLSDILAPHARTR
jgi:predicted metalloprotease with PDZ domain